VIEMAVKLVNLTPHPLVIFAGGGQITVPPSGTVARVREVVEDVGELVLDDGTKVPLRRKFLSSEIEGLPEPQDGVVYVVSYLAAQVAWSQGRTDVMATGDPVRDEQGHIVGVKSLYTK
jgi:hypothetical protein